MNLLLKSIKDSPLSYLPRESLRSLVHFIDGYRSRCDMEGVPYDWQYDRWAFNTWLYKRFQMTHKKPIRSIKIMELFSIDDADAFHQHFALLAEFLLTPENAKFHVDPKKARRDFLEMVKDIRHRFVVHPKTATFLELSSYLMGDERAQLELGLAVDEGRATFRDFQEWVEVEKNSSKLRRPWFKIIEFSSGGRDSDNPACSLFFDWLDQYAIHICKPGLFEPIPRRTAGKVSRQVH